MKKNSFIHFTESQKQRAVETDLTWFLPLHGFKLAAAGREKRLKSDKSITVYGNKWYNHSEDRGGNPISLVQKLFLLDWKDAVTMLLNESGQQPINPKEERTKEPFVLPPKSRSPQKVVDYLIQERKLDLSIIMHFIINGTLYQNRYGGAVFVGSDSLGVPRMATIRGTNPKKRFVKTEAGSNRGYGFCHRGTSGKLLLFESPIDLLSYTTLHQQDWKAHSYLSLSGVASKAAVQFLKDSSHITHIVFCLDNDTAGRNADERIKAKLLLEFPEREFIFSVEKSTTKDWNLDLTNKSESSLFLSESILEPVNKKSSLF